MPKFTVKLSDEQIAEMRQALRDKVEESDYERGDDAETRAALNKINAYSEVEVANAYAETVRLPWTFKSNKRIINPNILKDALYYLRSYSGASNDKAEGVLVGVMATLMATGLTFEQAAYQIKALLPTEFRTSAIPTVWLEEILK